MWVGGGGVRPHIVITHRLTILQIKHGVPTFGSVLVGGGGVIKIPIDEFKRERFYNIK